MDLKKNTKYLYLYIPELQILSLQNLNSILHIRFIDVIFTK